MTAEWPTIALWWYGRDAAAATAAAHAADPIFGRPLAFYLFTLPAWQLAAGWLLRLAFLTFAMALFFFVASSGSRVLHRTAGGRVTRETARGLALRLGAPPAGDCGAGVSRAVRAAVRRSHDLCRRHLHRRAHHAHRHAAGVDRARRRGGDGRRRRPGVARASAGWSRAMLPALVALSRDRRGRRLRRGLHREAERARARAAVHHPQHRVHAAGVRAEPDRAARLSRRDHGGGGRRGEQPGDAAEHPAVGLARAPGHAAAAPGDPHLLRLSRHRHRPLRHRRHAAPGDARDARAERREAAREQPHLDQREADLHPRLRV